MGRAREKKLPKTDDFGTDTSWWAEDESEGEFAFSGRTGAESGPLTSHTRRLEDAGEGASLPEDRQTRLVSEGPR